MGHNPSRTERAARDAAEARGEWARLPARPPPGLPMDLGNMREFGVRSLNVTCRNCKAERAMNVDAYPDALEVPSFGPLSRAAFERKSMNA